MNKILRFLFFAGLTLATPFVQNDVDQFIRSQNLVPKSATLKKFVGEEGKATITYKDQFTTYKFMVGKNEQDKPYVIFRQQMTQINFSSGNTQDFPEMNFMLPPPPMMIPMPQMPQIDMQAFNIPEMPMVAVPQQKFDHEMLAGNMPSQHKYKGWRRNKFGEKRPCRLDEEDVKTLLKQNLVIFKDAQIQNIKKVGFQRQNGIVLQITLDNAGKMYLVNAGYMPRWRKLNVLKVQEAQAEVVSTQQTPLDTGKELIGKVLENIQQKPANFNMGFENLLQSFVEKLLVRKNIKTSEETPEVVKKAPILLGSEGQKQATMKQPPILLGFEGEQKATIKQAPFLLGSEGQKEAIKVEEEPKQPLLLGREGQPENPFKFQETKPSIKPQAHKHSEQNSEQLSELVTEVISKLQLKSK